MADISRVVPGQKIKASTINSLIDSIPDLEAKGIVSFTKSGAKWNLEVPQQLSFQRKGQKFNQPFDLSTNNCLSSADELSIQVVRPHLPNSEGGLDDISVISPMTFPAESEVSVWLCELSGQRAGQKVVRSSQDSELEDLSSSRLMWRILPNGVVAEDLRWSALRGSGLSSEEALLDLSSLNWTSKDSEASAQTWNYRDPKEEDLVNIKGIVSPEEPDPQEISAISCNVDKWRFLARPEDGGTLHYASLKDVLSSLEDGCIEISAAPIEALSADMQVFPPTPTHVPKIGDNASFYNHWQTLALYKKKDEEWSQATNIWGVDYIPAIMWLVSRLSNSPFFMEQDNTDPRRGVITNCWCYVGRRLCQMADTPVNGSGTYYLQIDTTNPLAPAIAIVMVANRFPQGVPQNTNVLTYYPLWWLPDVQAYDFTRGIGTPLDLRGTWQLPFYSD